MPTVQDLAGLTAHHAVTLLAPDALSDVPRHEIKRIVILQDLAMLQRVPEKSLVIVPSGLFTRQDSSGLDVLIKRVSERGVLAVLLQGLVQAQPRLQRVTLRYDVAVLGCPASVDLGDLVTTLNLSVSGGPANTLSRVSLALNRVSTWMDQGDGDPAGLAAEVGSLIGEPLAYGPSPTQGTAVLVNGFAIGYIGTGSDAVQTVETQIVLPALVNAISTQHLLKNQLEYALQEERSRALTALIVTDSASIDHYAAMARQLSIDVDGFHMALAIHSEVEDPVIRDLDFRHAQSALENAFASMRVEVHSTRIETGFGMIITSRDHRRLTSSEVNFGVQQAIQSLATPTLFWGLGTEHIGPAGIRTSMYEARSASNSAAIERNSRVVLSFDASGVQRLISEVRASVTASRIASEILKPLDGMSNRAASIETLNAWLEERGSLKSAATRLHLHPNAVAYRINKTADALGMDLTDPDTRFALQLACRVALANQE